MVFCGYASSFLLFLFVSGVVRCARLAVRCMPCLVRWAIYTIMCERHSCAIRDLGLGNGFGGAFGGWGLMGSEVVMMEKPVYGFDL